MGKEKQSNDQNNGPNLMCLPTVVLGRKKPDTKLDNVHVRIRAFFLMGFCWWPSLSFFDRRTN